MTRETLDRIKWAGWLIVASVGITMGTWMCASVVANSQGLAVIKERQQSQYEQLREDIADLRSLVAK